jgi:hypothetical protein
MSIQEKIVATARSYIGQQEILGNKGFKDPALLSKMKAAGWQVGFAWCALMAEIIWKEAYGETSQRWIQFNKLFSASSLATYYNFAHAADITVSTTPVPGAVVIWKHGTDPAKTEGHTGIVTAVVNGAFYSVEGNTSGTDPNIREGYIVAEKAHKLGLPPVYNGLNVVGFIWPPEDI